MTLARLLSTAALAATMLAAPARAWEPVDCTNLDGGAIQCTVDQAYTLDDGSDQKLMIGIIGGNGHPINAVLYIGDTSWRMPDRKGLTALIGVDGASPAKRPAMTSGVLVQIALASGDLDLLAKGRKLQVAMPGFRANYDLSGSRDAIARLAREFMASIKEGRSSDPFTSQDEPRGNDPFAIAGGERRI